MQSYSAELGLLVSWGGFTKSAESEARTKHFQIRLWDQSDVLSALFRTYDRFPEEMKAELPLTRSWLLVQADAESG
jgi:restriction system protein